jgi:hypothetical protein
MKGENKLKIASVRKRISRILEQISSQKEQISYFHEFSVTKQWGFWPDRSKNPLTSNPRRHWSQSDEDGIIAKIFERISHYNKVFVEFGCGDGLENNTLALISKGWQGGWIDGAELAFEMPSNNTKVSFQNAWVTCENVVKLYENAVPVNNKTDSRISVLSIDLDGNDYQLLKTLLSADKSADLIVLEYNGRFPVGAEWVMPYNPNHIWEGNDYFGASLTAFVNLLHEFNYQLVACSVQGSNAFFINKIHCAVFQDISKTIEEIYQPPLYYLVHQWSHKASPSTVESMLKHSSL